MIVVCKSAVECLSISIRILVQRSTWSWCNLMASVTPAIRVLRSRLNARYNAHALLGT